LLREKDGTGGNSAFLSKSMRASPWTLENKMANPQRLPEDEQETGTDAARLRKRLSPDLSEVLHMLDAFEARIGMKTKVL